MRAVLSLLEGRGDREMSTAPIEEVLAERTPHWMAIPGVVGTAIGRCDEKLCITVYVSEKTDEVTRAIPESID